jgi:hypothetical protein
MTARIGSDARAMGKADQYHHDRGRCPLTRPSPTCHRSRLGSRSCGSVGSLIETLRCSTSRRALERRRLV